MKGYILEYDARNNAIRDARSEGFDMAVVKGDVYFHVIALDDPTIDDYEFIAGYSVNGSCILDDRKITLERYEMYWEMVYPSGRRMTAKTRTLITGYCKKQGIIILQEVDKRPKKISTVLHLP